MSTNTMARRHDKNDEYTSTHHRADSPAVTALDKSIIAAIPPTLIEQMTRDELLLLIRVADIPLWRGHECHELLAHKDTEMLKRMAYLARHSCQNQIERSIHGESESQASPTSNTADLRFWAAPDASRVTHSSPLADRFGSAGLSIRGPLGSDVGRHSPIGSQTASTMQQVASD